MRSNEFWSDKLARANIQEIVIPLTITGATTLLDHSEGSALVANTTAIADADIDTFLGETDATTADAFDATSMAGPAAAGDMLGGVVDCGGHVKELIGMKIVEVVNATAHLLIGCEDSASMTGSGTITECAKTAGGNIAFRANMGSTPDFDAATAGLVLVTFFVKLK